MNERKKTTNAADRAASATSSRASTRHSASPQPQAGGGAAGDAPSHGAEAEDMRLNKAVAASGFCARRKADELIFAGRVAVDGKSETNPARRVSAGAVISVDGKPLCRKQKFAYLLLHKPVRTVCTLSDPQGRPTGGEHPHGLPVVVPARHGTFPRGTARLLFRRSAAAHQ